MKDKLDFNEWWNDFSYQFRNDKDGGYQELSRLITEVKNFSKNKQEAFINEMIQFDNLQFYSCALIAEFGSDDQVGLIRDKACELINNCSADIILHEYIKVLISKYQPSDESILTKYFIDFQTQSQAYIRVPGELFNIDKSLFLKAFTINIERYPIDKLCKEDGLLYMISHLEALEYLIKNLPFALSEKNKLFALSKVNHSFAQHDIRLKNKLMELAYLEQPAINRINKKD